MTVIVRTLILLAAAGLATAAGAREDWQLGHGPFTAAADVRAHSRAPLDWRDMEALAAKGDWTGALALYAAGRHFEGHSLALVADDYNGRLGAVLPLSSRKFGTPSFQALEWGAALMKTGRFRRASDAERLAFLGAAAPALLINWARYELGEAERKANGSGQNWELTNGAPKNWNEIFAFYHGPDGRGSAFEAVAAAGGGEVSEALYAALAEGQADLLRRHWPLETARRVRALLDRASLVLLRRAIADELAGDPTLPRQRAAGAWTAAAEAALATATLTAAIEPALGPKAGPDDYREAVGAIDRALGR